MAYLIGCILLFAALPQGGFFPSVFLLSGILSALISLKGKNAPCVAELLLFAFAVVYGAASLFSGYSSQSLAQAMLPMSCVLLLRGFVNLPLPKRETVLNVVLVGGGIFAVIALLAFADILPILGAVTQNRLQFPFQYANASGAFYGALILIAQDRKHRAASLVLLPLTVALFLTRSVGALGIYLILQVVRLLLNRKSNRALWKRTLLIHTLALVFAGGIFLLNGIAALPLILGVALTGIWVEPILGVAEKCKFHWISLIGFGGALVLAFTSNRFARGMATFAERLVQIHDGLTIFARFPLTGIGAGNWSHVYPRYQSAQYVSTVVHSGPIQFAVDGGIFAVILPVVALVLVLRHGNRPRSVTLAACMLLLHSFGDFTLQFFPLTSLLLILLFFGEKPHPMGNKGKHLLRLGCLACALVFTVLLLCEQFNKKLVYEGQLGQWDAVVDDYRQWKPLLGDHSEANTMYLQALYITGDHEAVIEAAKATAYLTTPGLLLHAKSLYCSNRADEAYTLLLDQLERQPYQVGLFEDVATLLTAWEADEVYLRRYDQIVQTANDNKNSLGDLLGNQVQIDRILP